MALASAAFCLAAVAAVGRARLGESPLSHLDVVQAVFGSGARLLFAAMAITATASLPNMGLGAVPRMPMDVARSGEAFPILARTNARGVPWVATVLVAALPAVPGLVAVIGTAWVRVGMRQPLFGARPIDVSSPGVNPR